MNQVERTRLQKKYGPWALVTGASSGIGCAIANQLAQAGLHLVLTGRVQARLESQADSLQAYGIKIQIVEADLGNPEGRNKLADKVLNMDIGLFVAAAGFGTSGPFLSTSRGEELDMLMVNCAAVLDLTHRFASRFASQNRGGIVLLSSLVAFQGVPWAANYSASKAYIQSLAEGLRHELKPYNVDVLASAPGPVESGFGKRAEMRMSNALKPEAVARETLRSLGRRGTVLPCLLTKFLVGSLNLLPRWGKVRVMKQIMWGMTKHNHGGRETIRAQP